jgi:adenylate cyclase
MYKKALLGAIELRELQKKFFSSLEKRYQNKIDKKSLKSIENIIDAGIGVTVGNVVMGNLGPLHGIKKFGILGDPLNLVSRIESLTRLFNTEIIIAGDFLDAVKQSGLVVRKLGTMKVKGRLIPETLYALGCSDDQRFEQANIEKWTYWLEDLELNKCSDRVCPDCYQKDKNTLETWNRSGLLGDDGVWYLDEK